MFAKTLLRWYEENGRALPWRDTSDPYRIWVSEVILQQTRVSQGRDYYLRFIARFPNVKTLAEASEDEVLRLWQGLGYYSRARNLHAAARQVMERGGTFPHTFKELRGLRGVGDYTAAAIASFAFNEPCAAIDGNVQRVLSRIFGLAAPLDTARGKRDVVQVCKDLLPKSDAARFNSAMMDFGSLCCTPERPHCDSCPFSAQCVALKDGRIEELPVRRSRPLKVQTRYFTYVFLVCADQLLLRRRPAGDIWQGLYEPLLLETTAPATLADVITAFPILARTTLQQTSLALRHQLTHRLIIAQAFCATYPQPLSVEGYQPVSLAELSRYAMPQLVVRLAQHTSLRSFL